MEILKILEGLTYKFPPFLNLSVGSQFNSLTFPSPYSDADFFSLNSKIDISFSSDLFLVLMFNIIINLITSMSTRSYSGDFYLCQIFLSYILTIIMPKNHYF